MAKVRPDLAIERLLQNEVITFDDLRKNHMKGTLSEFLSYYRIGGDTVQDDDTWTFEQMFEDDTLTDDKIREKLEYWLELINEIVR